jgi:hypothetical protein
MAGSSPAMMVNASMSDSFVMPGFDPGIHVREPASPQNRTGKARR